MARVLVDITAHGYGHLAQSAPLLRRLKEQSPRTDIVIRCGLPSDILKQFLPFPFETAAGPADLGVVNHPSAEVDVVRTLDAYRTLAPQWDAIVDADVAFLETLKPDLLIANTGFLSIESACRVGIPVFHLASLDWHSILSGYASGVADIAPILDRMATAYKLANVRLRLEPGMPGAHGVREVVIGTSARKGRERKAEILKHLGLSENNKIALFAFGAGGPKPPAGNWYEARDTLFIVPEAWRHLEHTVAADTLPFPFIDLIASADICVAKIGYGIVTETVCNGCPFLFYSRAGWGEDSVLIAWLKAFGVCEKLDEWTIGTATFERLASQKGLPMPAPDYTAPERFAKLALDAVER